MNAIAWVVHSAPGRVRLRLPQQRHDTAFFSDLADLVTTLESTVVVRANAATASLLIEFHDSPGLLDELSELLLRREVELRYGDPPIRPAMPEIRAGIRSLDHHLRQASGQATDLRGVGVLFFFALAVLQAARGRMLTPATSLLWYAAGLLRDPAGGSRQD